MNIIPVYIRKNDGSHIKTYAFLDTGSFASFCAKPLCEKLNMDCNDTNKVRILLSTVQPKKETLNSHIVTDLIISNYNGKNLIKLPPLLCYMRFCIKRIYCIPKNN